MEGKLREEGTAARSRPHAYEGQGGSATLDLFEVARVLRRDWHLVAATTALLLALSLFYSLLKTAEYEAYGVVLVKTGQTSRPTGPIDDVLALQHTARTIDNELGVLRQSLPLAERVMDRLPREVLVEQSGLEAPVTAAALARYLLEERVRFEVAGEGMDMIKISARAPEAEQAASIARAYVEAYLLRSRDVNRAGAVQSRTFLAEQVDKRREELQHIEADLVAFMEQERAVALDAESQQAVGQAAALEASLEAARVALEMERATLHEIEREVARLEPGLLRRVASSAEQEIVQMQARIAELEMQAQDYYALDPTLRGNEGRNPDLAALAARIEEARRVLDARSEQLVAEVLAAGGVGADGDDHGLAYVSRLRRDVVEKSVRVRGLEAKIAALDRQLEGYREKMRGFPERTVRLAQLQRAQKAAEQTYLVLTQKLQEARVAEESQIGFAELVRPPLVPEKPVAPVLSLSLLVGMLMGLFTGAGLVLVRAAVTRRLQTPDDVRGVGLPVLAVVQEHPEVRRQVAGHGVRGLLTRGRRGAARTGGAPLDLLEAALESFRYLRTSIRMTRSHVRTVMVTSAAPGEGKTSIALNLAGAMVQSGLRALYIDADMRRPTSHSRLGLARGNGLSDILAGEGAVDWERYRCAVSLGEGPAATRIDELYVVPAGAETDQPTELLESARMRDVIAQATAAFDVVVVDTPPLLAVADPALIAPLCDAVLFVVASGTTTREMLVRARERLDAAGPKASTLLGVVLNGVDARTARGAEYGYGYGYGYGYASPVPSGGGDPWRWGNGRRSRGEGGDAR